MIRLFHLRYRQQKRVTAFQNETLSLFFLFIVPARSSTFNLRTERTHRLCKQCFRLYKNTFCVAKCLLGKCPKPLCSAFFNAGCASRRDTFYPMIRSGSLRTCIRCDAASAREAYFICLLQVTSTSIPSRFFKESITGL